MRRTALVTGGGRGIGRATVQALAEHAWVAALDTAFPDGPGAASRTLETDVRDSNAIQRAVDSIVQERGGLDWVISGAGIVRDRMSWKMSDQDWEDVMAVNLGGAFHVARAAAPHLRRSDSGRLIFIGSINGTRGRLGQANYAASKAGLVGLARTLAHELARDGVTVNVITPGFIETPMTNALPVAARAKAVARTPLGRTGHPEEVAALVRFLCAEEAAFITGATIPVDGGQLLGAVE
ncbi:MAG: 3-oxoacyl-ACP reductase FabG [Gemmatimonadetes bacterium]|nr:3-oxoacyl-ACP reductase FabG [Gemmatimonadota bacterium]